MSVVEQQAEELCIDTSRGGLPLTRGLNLTDDDLTYALTPPVKDSTDPSLTEATNDIAY